MHATNEIVHFIHQYESIVEERIMKLRAIVFANLPEITEQLDKPARMIAYCYGQKNVDLICVIIPSKKGIKLGFNRGVQLNDPQHLLKGSGKISRYIEIDSDEIIYSSEVEKLIQESYNLYKTSIHKS